VRLGARYAATTVALVLWRAVIQPLAPFAFAVSLLMWMACAVIGLALSRVAVGRT